MVSPIQAQQAGVVTGTVRDATTLEPLSGVQVTIVGGGIGALSDTQGGFLLDGVPEGSVEVRLERLGYETSVQSVTVTAGQTVSIDFALSVSVLSLDEMIITVTGLQRRREIGNATTTIDVEEEVRRGIPEGILGLLQGRVSGVQVLQSSGSVGATPSITIRGSSSILLDDTPIIYVDGTRVSNDLASGPDVGGQTTSRLSDLNLDDIESIEIVNGPSAATLYGTEAAAGVIRITTKKGRTGTSEWTLNSELGANWDATDWPLSVWNPRSFFGEVLDIAAVVGGVPPGQVFVEVPDTLYTLSLLEGGAGTTFGTPWRTGLERSHGVSVRGGAGNVTYFLSGELSDRLGNLSNNDVTKRTLRANVNLTPGADVNVQVATGFASSRASLPNNDNSNFGFIGVGLLGFPWATPMQRTDPVSGAETETCPEALELQRAALGAGAPIPLSQFAGACAENPFFEGRTFDDVATLENDQKVERFTGSVSVDYRPFSFLQARGTIGYDQFSDHTGQLVPVDPTLPFNDLSQGFRSTSSALVRGVTVDVGANAALDLTESVRSTTSVGGQLFGQKIESTSSLGRSLPPGINTVSNAVRTEGFESILESRTMGLYVQEQIAYQDRLFLTPAIRVDQSSTFGDDRTRETYPRLMGSWVVSEESWFAGVPLLSSLRLRGAWGQSGKQPAPFAALQLLGTRAVTFNGLDVSGVVLVGAGNADLKPERGEEIELGFDATAWNGRVGLDFTWFRQVTRDALIERPISPSTGYALGQVENLGELRNSGLEFTLNAVAWDAPGVRLDWRLNLASLNSEITRLDEPIIFGLQGNSQRYQQGHPIASYFSHTYSIQNDQVVASDSAVYVGKPTPSLAGSLITTLSLFDWLQLNAVLGFAAGHQQFNGTEQFRCGFLGGGTYGGICPEIYAVDGDGQRTNEARIKAAAARDFAFSPWIEDADFARLRSLSARIEIPASVLRILRADRGSFTVVGENLALFTGYSGLDPEVNYVGGGQRRRAEFLTLPLARRVLSRVTLTF